MTTPQIVSSITFFLLQIILPAFFICWIAFGKNKSKLSLTLKLLSVWAYVLFIYDTAMWSLYPYFLRYVILFLLIAVSIKALLRVKTLPTYERKSIWGWIALPFQLILPLLFFWLFLLARQGHYVEEKGIDISFPLREGFIGHGGNFTLINYHHEDSTAQQYALDIARLNGWGMRAEGLFPESLEKYTIYGDTLFSPCDGKIVMAKDGLDNFPPGTQSMKNPTGNTIVIEYKGHLILLAHLLKHSVKVAPGDSVKTGQAIARIGNSGHTSEPHLHIHAVAGTDTSKVLNGNGVPIFFDGEFLVRNDRVKK